MAVEHQHGPFPRVPADKADIAVFLQRVSGEILGSGPVRLMV